MNYKEFLELARARFNLPYRIEKEKARHFMLSGDETAVGPDIGHSSHDKDYGITVNGWAYTLKDGEWKLERDGIFSWRSGDNPHPEIL